MVRSFTLIAPLALVLSAGAAIASPQIPTPVNPFPAEPVATDGSPLPVHVDRSGRWLDQVLTGRSVGIDARVAR